MGNQMESISIVLRSLRSSNNSIDLKKIFKDDLLDCRISLNSEYIVFRSKENRCFFVYLCGKSSGGTASSISITTDIVNSNNNTVVQQHQSLLSASLTPLLAQQQQTSTQNTGGSTTPTSSTQIYNREYLDQDLIVLEWDYSEGGKSSGLYFQMVPEEICQMEWVSPLIIRNTVQLYSDSYRSVSVPSHLCILDTKKTLHLLTLFNNQNIQKKPDNDDLQLQDIKLKKKLCIIPLYKDSVVDQSKCTLIQTSGTNDTCHYLHHYSIEYDHLIQMLDLSKVSSGGTELEIINNIGDGNGNIILLFNRCTIVHLKIKQIDSYHYIFFVQRKFQLSNNQMTKEIITHIKISRQSSSGDHLIKLIDKWLFVFNLKSCQIELWNLNGKKRGIIYLIDYFSKNNITIESNEFLDFAISTDLLTISILDSQGNIYVLAIDDYFQQSQPLLLHSVGIVNYCIVNKTDDDCDIYASSQELDDEEENDISADEDDDGMHSSDHHEETESDQDEVLTNDQDEDFEADEKLNNKSGNHYVKIEDINNRNDIFLFHWYETDESLLTLNESQKEFDSMIHWLPRKPLHKYSNNGFNVNSSGFMMGSGNSASMMMSGLQTVSPTMSRENSFMNLMKRSTSIDFHQHLKISNNNAFSQSRQLPTYDINSCYKVTLPLESRISSSSKFSFFLTPKLIMLLDQSSSDSHFYYFDRYDSSSKSERIVQEKVMLMLMNDQSFYFFTECGINALLIDQNQQQILNNLIMFEGSVSANHLCALNNWNKRDLKIHALHLGLKYRQLDVVEPALKSLDLDQQLIGSQLLVTTILENSANAQNANVHNETFTLELLHIGMNFIGLIIRDRASLVHQSLSKLNQSMTEINWTETLTTPLHENNQNLSLASLNDYFSANTYSSTPSSLHNSQENISSQQSTPIQDLLNFTTILESLRMFQKQQQKSPDILQPPPPTQQPLPQSIIIQSTPVSLQSSTSSQSSGNRSRSTSLIPPSQQQLQQASQQQQQPIDMSNWFNPGLLERWDRMEELEIIKESLMSSTISSAIAYINWRREKKQSGSGASSTNVDIDTSNLPKFIPSVGPLTLDHIKKISSCFIYQAVSQEQLDQAIKLLTTVGIPLIPNLRQLAFSTSRRNIRNLLIGQLANHPQTKETLFTIEMSQLLEFSSRLEKLYPGISFHREFSKLSFKWRPFAESKPPLLIQQQQQLQQYLLQQQQQPQDQNNNQQQQLQLYNNINDEDIKLLCQEVDDVLPDTEHYYGFQIVTHGSAVSTGQQTNVYSSGFLRGTNSMAQHHQQVQVTGSHNLGRNRIILYPPITHQNGGEGDGYSHYSLNDLMSWQPSTKERVLIEKKYELLERDLIALLNYHIAHNQFQAIAEWIRMLSTQQLEYLQSLSNGTVQPDNQHSLLYNAIIQALCNATPTMRDLFLNHLASQRIFLVEAETLPLFHLDNNAPSSKDKNSLLLKRLAKNQLLYPDSSKPTQYPLTLEFHKFFLKFCIEQKLYPLLSSYIQAYDIQLDSEESRVKYGIELHQLAPQAQLLFLLKSKSSKIDRLKANIINLLPLLNGDQETDQFLDLRIMDNNNVRAEISVYFSVINKVLEKYPQRPLLVLSSLMYSPCKLKNLLLHQTSTGQKLQSSILLDSIKVQYPTLHSITNRILNGGNVSSPRTNISNGTRDISTAKGDITLSELLDANSLFNLSNLFVNQDPLQKLVIPDLTKQNFKEGYIDNLDMFYFLEKGRPIQARSVLGDGVLSSDQKDLLGWLLRIWTLRHIHQEKSVSSALVLLDLLDMPQHNLMLKVDISIAKRILTKKQISSPLSQSTEISSPLMLSSNSIGYPQSPNSPSSSNSSTNSELKDDCKLTNETVFTVFQIETLNLFIQMYPTPDDMQQQINNSDTNVQPLPPPDRPIHRIITRFESTISLDCPIEDFNSKWYLLSRFCQVHGICKITKRLEYLAMNNQWLEFLYESQIQEFPLSQIKDILRKFTNSGIRNHLLLVIEKLSNERKRQYIVDENDDNTTETNRSSELLNLSKQYFSLEESTLSGDIIAYVLSAFRSNDPASYLLYNATKDKRPLLAVVANCVGQSQVTTIECLVTWLCVNITNLSKFLTGHQHSNINTTSANVDDSFDFDLDALDISLDHHVAPNIKKYNYDDLTHAIQYIIQNRKSFLLLEGFKIFIPENILLNYLVFINQFHQYRFEESQESLNLFIKDMENYKVPNEHKDVPYFNSRDSIRSLVVTISENLVDLLSSYEREHFLSILHQSSLSPVFSTLHSTLNLLKRTQLGDKNIRMDPKVIIKHLLEKGLFVEARTYSVENSLDNDIITLAEVESLVNHYKHGCLWDMEQERTNLWKKSQQYFIQHQCRPSVAGEFFFNKSHLVSPSKEKILLLNLAVEWFEKQPNISKERREFIDDLKNQQLLISVGLSIEDENQKPQFHFDTTNPSSGTYNDDMEDYSDDEGGYQRINSYFTSPIHSPPDSLSSSPELDSPMKDYQKHRALETQSNNSYLQSHPISALRTSYDTQQPTQLATMTGTGDITIDTKGLDIVIAKLLNCSNFYQADQICQQFSFKSYDYELINAMLKIVNRQIPPNPKQFPAELVMALMQNHKSMKWIKSVQSYDQTTDNILQALETLSSVSLLAKPAAKTIICKFNVSEKLKMTYQEMQSQNPYQIVSLLLKHGRESFRLLKSFISCCHLDHHLINEQLADQFSSAVISYYSNTQTTLNNSAELLEETPTSPSSNTTKKESIDPHWTSEEFHEFIRIGKDPYSFGMMLIEKSGVDMTSLQSQTQFDSPLSSVNLSTPSPTTSPNNNQLKINSLLSMEAESELFVRAHFCFVISCSVDGTILVLNIVKSRIHHYAQAGKYKLLVRLITGMQCYNELQAIFDILLEHDRFELLLRKKIHQHEDQNGLKLALNSYLLKKQPLYSEKLSMLYLRFNMFKEIAQNHEQKARSRLEGLSREKSQNLAAFNKELLEIMKELLDAADSYSKERSNRTAQQCISLGALLALQIKTPDQKLINLRPADAKLMFIGRTQFKESLIVANAYSLNNHSDWISALFQQVLVQGNFQFLHEYIQYFSQNNLVFIDLIKKYKSEPKLQKPQNVKSLILSVVTDKNLKLEFAKELQFEDILKDLKNK
ncbi:hypothetical protein DLAC_01274 [Tieghemostelium lacteum]|uniref:Spatacsin C-terminal domain-containing protein n=1 Tax=Tieghemostelium lacteum TaxID=361077 RepID=A0A152A8B3_TIELA|nr:hypothetical protein DLAC_01274 [Tieghemostelium lacteum]|eukprot:KYR02434.1 hypothetical protein DLAC_01274 [Tieghemostelium lacteum]